MSSNPNGMSKQQRSDELLKAISDKLVQRGWQRPIANVFSDEVMALIEASYTPNSEVEKRCIEAQPNFMKPGGIIPYDTIDSVKYVRLDWLQQQLNGDNDNAPTK